MSTFFAYMKIKRHGCCYIHKCSYIASSSQSAPIDTHTCIHTVVSLCFLLLVNHHYLCSASYVSTATDVALLWHFVPGWQRACVDALFCVHSYHNSCQTLPDGGTFYLLISSRCCCHDISILLLWFKPLCTRTCTWHACILHTPHMHTIVHVQTHVPTGLGECFDFLHNWLQFSCPPPFSLPLSHPSIFYPFISTLFLCTINYFWLN